MKYYKIMNVNGVIGIFGGNDADTIAVKEMYENMNLKVIEISKESFDLIDYELSQ